MSKDDKLSIMPLSHTGFLILLNAYYRTCYTLSNSSFLAARLIAYVPLSPLTIQNTSRWIRDIMCHKRNFDTFAAPQDFAWPPLTPDLESTWGEQQQCIGDRVASGESLTAITAGVCQLTNDVHPIFAADRFLDYEDVVAGRFPCGKEHYTAMVPSLRLASAILTHKDSLPFWHGLIVAGRRDQEEGAKNPFPSFHAKRRLTEQETEETLQLLEECADIVVWKIIRMLS